MDGIISYFKEIYGGESCKVIRVCGDYECIFEVRLSQKVKVKFLFADTSAKIYPEVVVIGLDVRMDGLDRMERRGVKEFMGEVLKVAGEVEEKMGGIENYICGGENKSDDNSENNNTISTVNSKEKSNDSNMTENKNIKNKKYKKLIKMQTKLVRNQNSEDDIYKKKKMKTCDDVIKRILWDGELKGEDFVVGYEDRFLGELEENFANFYWNDISCVGPDVFAIPRHRIRYFKYKDEMVWHRRLRIDRVFASQDSDVNIHEVVVQYQKKDGGSGGG